MKQNNFWNKISESEIYIYGDIVDAEFNFETFEVKNVAKKFAEDLNSCGENVTIHINSNGGDCFVALAIANLISQSKKNITASIDGICASAATLISSACKKVCMAENALMMIHLPMTLLYDFYDAIELAKIESSLNKVRDSILTTYAKKTGQEISLLTKLMNEETWLTAEEAKNLNFVDEITGAVDIQVDNENKILIFNSLNLKKNYYSKAKEKMRMDNKSLLEKIKNLLKGETAETAENVSEIRAAEVERIKNLNNLRCENVFVNALIDVAITEGRQVGEVGAYIDALKKVSPENRIREELLNLLEDNCKSGAGEVTASLGDFENKNDSKIKADMIAKFF